MNKSNEELVNILKQNIEKEYSNIEKQWFAVNFNHLLFIVYCFDLCYLVFSINKFIFNYLHFKCIQIKVTVPKFYHMYL